MNENPQIEQPDNEKEQNSDAMAYIVAIFWSEKRASSRKPPPWKAKKRATQFTVGEGMSERTVRD